MIEPHAPQVPERPFRVHAADEHRARGHRVEAPSFEAAAVAFVERWSPEPDAGHDVSVIVEDLETGRECCFRIDLDTGDAAPCQ